MKKLFTIDKGVLVKRFLLLGLLGLMPLVKAADKVLIITHVHSRPDFIELHVKTFKAFLKDDYEYVVFNDAANENMCKQMEQTCQRLGVKCIRIPQHLHVRPDAGARHMDGIRYSLEIMGFEHDGIVLMIDSDMFLIRPFSVVEYMQGYALIGGAQYRSNETQQVTYIFPGLVFMDMGALPNKRSLNFDGGYIHGLACDVGGHLYYYMQNNPGLKYKLFNPLSTNHLPATEKELQELGYDSRTIHFIKSLRPEQGMEFHADNNFLHYYAGGSNWPGYSAEYLREKTRLLNNYIEQIL